MHAITELIDAFHAAVAAQDPDRLVALAAPDIEVGGPRGSVRGATHLQEWLARTGIRLEPGEIHVRGSVVVVAERAQWAGEDQWHDIALLFEAADGKLTHLARFDDLNEALIGL